MITNLLCFLARQNNNEQRPRPFVVSPAQSDYRGYLPPQPPPQPEFNIPTTSSQYQPAATPSANPYFVQSAEPSQTVSPPPPSEDTPLQPLAPVAGAELQPSSSPDVSTQTQGFVDIVPTSFQATNQPLQPELENPVNLQFNNNDITHPPHIHEMNVQCSKDMMTINVEFNRPYYGVVYSKVGIINCYSMYRYVKMALSYLVPIRKLRFLGNFYVFKPSLK